MSLEKELAKLKKKKSKRKSKSKSKKRKQRSSTSDDDNTSVDSSPKNGSPATISMHTVTSAYDKPIVSPLILRTTIDEQPCTANTLQPSTANADEDDPHITKQPGPAFTKTGTTSPAPIDFVASTGANIGETLSLLPTDDNLTEEDGENNATGTFFEGVDLPYNSDPFAPPVDNTLCEALSNIWQKKFVYHEMKPVWDKYPLPSNLGDHLKPPEMNSEVFKLLQKWQQAYDTKWFRIQQSLTKCVSATLQLNDLLAKADIDRSTKTCALQTTIDMTQMISQVNTEISIKR